MLNAFVKQERANTEEPLWISEAPREVDGGIRSAAGIRAQVGGGGGQGQEEIRDENKER